MQADRLYSEFTGHKGQNADNVNINMPKAGLTFGKCDGILYSTVRDGELEKYIHQFKQSARPDLVASFDGKQLFLIGGNFTFTERRIVDN